MRSDDGSARWEFAVEELRQKLTANREAHVQEYKEAFAGYMEQLQSKLETMLTEVELGKDIETYIGLDKPRSHEKDYDRILDVLEMTTAKTVKLTLGEFDKYVRDNWEWTESFKMSSANYR